MMKVSINQIQNGIALFIDGGKTRELSTALFKQVADAIDLFQTEQKMGAKGVIIEDNEKYVKWPYEARPVAKEVAPDSK